MMTDMRIQNKGRVNKAKSVRFTFNGKTYSGFEGDTLASALLANGEHLTGRSFKYHRLRGILSAGSEEPNALMGISRGARAGSSRTRAPPRWSFMTV
ncbi:sarcosine oxidase subunit alpha [Brucella vulpis]|nr:sarcosine oxidase subunit alpha [Brucella vulpis]CUW49287.1 sarcosine oxidase subunit alpha [Brucella vulpis]